MVQGEFGSFSWAQAREVGEKENRFVQVTNIEPVLPCPKCPQMHIFSKATFRSKNFSVSCCAPRRKGNTSHHPAEVPHGNRLHKPWHQGERKRKPWVPPHRWLGSGLTAYRGCTQISLRCPH